jgi:two-component system KDP operon response regulator KdpE
MPGARILLVDDEPAIQRALGPLLRARGYDVDIAASGHEALRLFADRAPDLIVLDLGLPDLEGSEVCRRIRQASPIPIVVLSARGGEADKVAALDLGADDYVTKPFGPEELLARIRVALRRVAATDEGEKGQLRAGDLTIDYDRHRVLRGGIEIRLTPKEFDLLSLLARNHDRVLTHRAILKAIWGANAVDQPEHLWTLVAQLRRKIEPDPASPRYLLSEPWVGYRSRRRTRHPAREPFLRGGGHPVHGAAPGLQGLFRDFLARVQAALPMLGVWARECWRP